MMDEIAKTRLAGGLRLASRPQNVRVVVNTGAKPDVKSSVLSSVLGTAAGIGTKVVLPAAVGGIGGVALGNRNNKKTTRKKRKVAVAKFVAAPTEESIRRQKKVQGVLTTTGASIGAAAFGAKMGAKALPKLYKAPLKVKGSYGAGTKTKGEHYAKHVDDAANWALFGGAGVGGVSGLHQGAVYRSEGKLKRPEPGKAKVVKAFSPERERQKELKNSQTALTAGAVAGGSASAGLAAQRHGARKKIKAVDTYNRVEGPAKHTARVHRAKVTEANLRYDSGQRIKTATDELNGPAKGNPVTHAGHAHKKKMRAEVSAGERGVAGADRLKSAIDRAGSFKTKAAPKVASKATIAAVAGAGAASAGGAVAVSRHRKNGGKRYSSWYDQAPVHKSMPDSSDLSSRKRLRPVPKPRRRFPEA